MRKVFCEALGKWMELPDRPERIVSLNPSATETLFLLGLDDKVRAVSAFCHRPPQARKKKVVGSYGKVDAERIREIDPDLIITTTGYQRDLALELSEEFPTYALELPTSVYGLIDFAVKVGLLAGVYEATRRLGRKLLLKLASVRPLDRPLRVYVEIDFGKPVSFGAFSYITDALSYLGAVNVFGDRPSEWLSPDFELVKAMEPDVIIYEAKMFKRFTMEDLMKLIEERGWDKLRASKAGSIFLTPGPLDFLAHHGPTFIEEAMPWLSSRLREALSLVGAQLAL